MLAFLYKVLADNKPENMNMNIYADIEGAKVNGGTIPPEIVTTVQRPDNSSTPASVTILLYIF